LDVHAVARQGIRLPDAVRPLAQLNGGYPFETIRVVGAGRTGPGWITLTLPAGLGRGFFPAMPPSQLLRVTHVSGYLEPGRRAPRELVRAWRDFGAAADAARRAGIEMTVVQASETGDVVIVGGVRCFFVPLRSVPWTVAAFKPDLIHWQGLILPWWLR